MTKHIAMWSGPRNISTAMMRSFENRSDTFVSDEPFYGYYLKNTDIDHPGRKGVLRSMETDWYTVSKTITGLPPNEEKVWYQKHMAQHNLPGVDLSWTRLVTNCFLIRDPKEVIISYHKKYEVNRAELLGYPQQVELYRMLTEGDCIEPAIVDAQDILMDPKDILSKLCSTLGIPFRDEMLLWPAGPRDTDGVWAKHWYSNVESSTGFKPYEEKYEELPHELEGIYEECLVYYDTLHRKRIY
ncbi:MAG: HAD family hydrolase [Candidatus Marinimicrobia bacterium]|nr:HAD family hydrolase [Candidatus Neomarinimicrobiota bacterium]HBN45093.1 sulfotransferase family protein [Candidatus Neomarinimicrobiota bacterium]HJL74887.1 HAD family hydrolase [Candidatus Neomarinimicrobiota bacterium]